MCNLKKCRIPKELLQLSEEGWVAVTEKEDLTGPLLISFVIAEKHEQEQEQQTQVQEQKQQHEQKQTQDHGQEHFLHFCSNNPTTTSALSVDSLPSAGFADSLTSGHVFVCQSLGRPGVVSFKTAHGRYLSSSKLGQLECNKEAVGPAEEWQIVCSSSSGAFMLQNSLFGRLLAYAQGRLRVDADQQSSGSDGLSAARLRFFCQAARRKERLLAAHQARLSTRSPAEDLSALAAIETKKYSGTRTKISANEAELKRAAESGHLREALLEKRIKSKHDPYC